VFVLTKQANDASSVLQAAEENAGNPEKAPSMTSATRSLYGVAPNPGTETINKVSSAVSQ
jgi:hypothetical protein